MKIEQRVNYIHNNPKVAGFVYHERDWVHSYEEDNKEMSHVKANALW